MRKHSWRKFLVACCSFVLLITTGAAFAACDKKAEAGPETGIYYYDADDGETYYVTFTDGDKVSMQIRGETVWGQYKLKDDAFSFTLNTDVEIGATYADKTVTLTYGGSQMVFYRSEKYTVTYETNGGSAIGAVKVLNGKTATKPADPVREGYVFLGWYADAEYKTAYSFGAVPVTDNVTVYARWSDKLTGAAVYSVDFDLNYEGSAALPVAQTIEGKLYDLPADPVRDGYTFRGWWISDYEDAEKLTALYDESYVFDADTTLFALWESASSSKLATPLPRVSGDSVVWDAVAGVATYEVEVVGPNGNTIVNQRTGATGVTVAFSSYAAGDYTISVRAISTDEAKNSDTAVRHYNNKALARVSQFSVIEPSVLLFNGVEGAENYKITVVCGNALHNHEDFNLGVSTYFNFADCEMTEGGIAFTVTASAAGRASSVSETYYYDRVLGKIQTFYFDEETETLSWDAVQNAADYEVVVTAGSEVCEILTNGKTSVSLKDFPEGAIKVTVSPKTVGYNSVASDVYEYAKVKLTAPTDLTVTGSILSWSAVKGATSYTVLFDGKEYTGITGTQYDLSALSHTNGVDYEVRVKANAAASSSWSDALTVQYYSLSSSIVYFENAVYWHHVVGATSYKVKVNDGEAVSVDAGTVYAEVALTQKGENVISVQYTDDMGVTSDWVSVSVYAYEISFDSREGTAADSLYLAMGDVLVLPESDRDGYDLEGWYNVPGAAQVNGKKYVDGSVLLSAGDLILYANWSPKPYNVTYDVTGGIEIDRLGDTVKYMGDYQLAIPTTNDTSLTFLGWYESPNGEGRQFTDAEGYSVTPWDIKGDKTLYPYFVALLEFSLQTDGTYKDTYSVVASADISRVERIVIPETYNDKKVSIIEGNAFRRITTLKTIEIPDTIEIVYYDTAFEGCTSLQAINVYETGHAKVERYSSHGGVLYYTSEVAQEGKELVYAPAALTGNYVIPDGVQSIGINAFSVTHISSVTIPSTVNNIAQYAFANSRYIADIYFDFDAGEELVIGDDAFAACSSLKSLTLPARATSFNPAMIASSPRLENIYVAEDHETYSSVNGLLCNKDGDTLLYCPVARRGALRIPAGIRTIASEAFKECKNLTSVVIPNYVTTIRDNAFEKCTRIALVTFAGSNSLGSALTVGENVFKDCTSLSSVVFEENSNVVALGDNLFNGCNKLTSLSLPATVKDLTPALFSGCTNLSKIAVHEDNPYYATQNSVLYNKSLTEILFYSINLTEKTYVLPDAVEKIGANVFQGNVSLETVIIGNNIKEIGANAFDGSPNLKTVVFVKGGTGELTIGDYAFANCSALAGLYVADTRAAAENGEYTLGTPTTLRSIGAYAFKSAKLGEVVLAEGLVTIGEYAYTQSKVTSISLPASLKTIGNDAFYRCTGLTTVNIAANSVLETIGDEAFSRTALAAFTVPKTVTSVGESAFSSTDLTGGFTFEEGRTEVISFGSSVFSGSKITAITFPDQCEVFYGMVDYWGTQYLETTLDSASYLKTINNLPANEDYAWEGGVLYDLKNGVKVAVEYVAWKDADYVIPNTVTYIKPGAFGSICAGSTLAFEAGGTEDLVIGTEAFNNSGLTSVAFPARLAKFEDDLLWQTMAWAEIYGSWAFEYSKVETVTFEDTAENPCRLTEIPNGTFNYMESLTEIVVPSGVKRIGDRAFGIGWNGAQLATVSLPEGLEEIGEYAFGADSQCESALTEIEIPSTVKYIGPRAFAVCMSLSTVTFAKDASGNCALEILGDGAFSNTAIKSITLPKTLAGSAYLEDENGKETTTPNGLLGDYMFAYCTSLATVVFEDGCPLITGYGNSCFGRCTQYANVTFPVNLETIEAWDSSSSSGSIKTITIPSKFTAETFRLFVPALSGVSSFTIEEGNPNLDIEAGGGIYGTISRTEAGQTISEKTLLYYPGNNTAESYVVKADTEVVDDYAFSENKYLKQVTLREGLLRIGEYAFGVTDYTRSTALESITIPKTVTELGEGAFAGATHLASITFVTEAQDNGYQTSALKKIGRRAFRGCTALTEIALPDSVTVLGMELQDYGTNPDIRSAVFYGCTSLETVTLPAGLDVLLGLTFTGCDSLQTVDFRTSSNALSRITPYAFYQSGIRTLNLSKANKLSEVTDYSFYECKNLTSVTFGTGTEIEIGEYAFAETSIASLVLPANVTAIGNYAFYNVETLAGVTVAENSKLSVIGEKAFYNTALASFNFENLVQLEEIGAYAFAETAIPSVLLCDTVVSVGDYAFYHCANVADFRLSASISYVGDYAFAGLPLITSVTIAGNDTTIGAGAFEDCSSLESVTLQSGVNTIGNFAFGFTAISTITLPETIVAFDGNPFPGCNLESIDIQAPNADLVFDAVAGTMLNADKTLLYFATPDTTTISFVDSSITSVMPGALAGTKITSITLPDSFTTIADGTFRNCKQLESIVIGKNITRIGDAAFEGCTALASVEFEQGGTQGISIGARAFKGCTALTEIELPDRLRDYGEIITRQATLFGRPWGEEEFNCGGAGIGESAFEGSGLVHVTYEKDVPESISTAAYEDTSLAIAPSAFKNCLALETAEFGKALGTSGDFYVKEEVEKLPDPIDIFDLFDYDLTQTSYLYISEYAFYNCPNLTTVVLQEEKVSNSSSSIGEYAFAGCTSLENFGYPTVDEGTGAVTYSVPTHVLFYRSYCFKGAGLKNFVIPASYNWSGRLVDCSVFEGAFQDCVRLETFVSHAYLGTANALGSTELGAYAFKGCTSLKTVVFDIMYVMGESAFEGCSALESVTLTFERTGAYAKNPLSIGDRVFK
ncbi:MAG: leucine-rich repeat protein, partial [Candidatus Gallimonas sp.]